ncbi:MAG: spore coat protein [Ruminococcaceae bacterium]|nr:spore coat protein [Oscillospiraceae bacterium]
MGTNLDRQSNMSEREMLEDGLGSQKQIASSYNTYADECVSNQLRATFLNILAEEHDLSAQLFDDMSARGWYQIKQAEQSDITKAKQRFLAVQH